MGTKYSVLYLSVLSKLKDYDLAKESENNIYEILSDYLRPAIVAFHNCKTDLTIRDTDLINGGFNEELSDEEVEILSNFMTINYIDANYLKVPNLLKANLSSVDYRAFSPANQIDKLNDLHKICISDNETLMARYSLIKLQEKMNK